MQVGVFAKKLHLTGLVRDAPKLSLPGKLVFPSMHNTGHFSMLGLGDIVSFKLPILTFHILLRIMPFCTDDECSSDYITNYNGLNKYYVFSNKFNIQGFILSV